jgi:hypothetical protein
MVRLGEARHCKARTDDDVNRTWRSWALQG